MLYVKIVLKMDPIKQTNKTLCLFRTNENGDFPNILIAASFLFGVTTADQDHRRLNYILFINLESEFC